MVNPGQLEIDKNQIWIIATGLNTEQHDSSSIVSLLVKRLPSLHRILRRTCTPLDQTFYERNSGNVYFQRWRTRCLPSLNRQGMLPSSPRITKDPPPVFACLLRQWLWNRLGFVPTSSTLGKKPYWILIKCSSAVQNKTIRPPKENFSGFCGHPKHSDRT